VVNMDVEVGKPEPLTEDSVGTSIQNILCLLLFMTLGPSLILINKHILRDLGFSYPITHTFYTTSFCSTAVWIYVKVLGIQLQHAPVVTLKFYVRNVLLIGFFQGATIVLGMTSYLYLTVSFVQMLKASTPVMIVIFLRLFKIEDPSVKILMSVLIISTGVIMSGYGEINFSIVGVLTMISGQVAEALRLVFTQKLLKNLRFTVLEGLCYVTPAASFWVLLAALVIEGPRMGVETLATVSENIYVFLTAGVLAVGVNTINSVVIKFTSSLMMKLLATARNASLVIFNVVFMSEVVTAVQFTGYSMSLGGFMLYNYYRQRK